MSVGFDQFLARIAISLPAFLLAISFHEFAHAYVATKLGDYTPKLVGRVTLNPFKHLNFLGTVCLLLFGIGWADPVPFDPRNFKRPKLYSILTALAGPFANFVLAYLFMYMLYYLPLNLFAPALALSLKQIIYYIIYINVMLGVFNLVPLPPLDGSHLLYACMPNSIKWIYFEIQRWAILVLFLLFYIPGVLEKFKSLILGVMSFLEALVI